MFDGTGAPGRVADVGIEGERIVAIGDLSAADARRIDARGFFVSPGFIDMHTHTDATVLGNPSLSSSVRQGVTTELCGNCGNQAGMALDTPELAREYLFAGGESDCQWSSLGQFMGRVEEQGAAINLAFLAGHGTLRKRAMGWHCGPPDRDLLRCMLCLLSRALEEGAFGLSSGLEYAPGSHADTRELGVLAAAVAAAGGIYATHLRNEAEDLATSVEEALAIAREAEVPLQISHLKAEGRSNWGSIGGVLERLDEARAQGIDVACDVYPYTAFMTGLGVRTLPPWAQVGSWEQIARRLRHPGYRSRVLAHMAGLPLDWDQICIAVAPGDRALQGRSIGEIARERGKTPQETVLDLLIQENGAVSSINFDMAEEDMRSVLRYEHASIGSDTAARAPHGRLAEDGTHPRAFGTFPRVLGRYARDEGVLTWSSAIHKMTGLPAQRLGLRRRGTLAPGAYADVTVFDPGAITDTASYADPFQYPAGIRHVFVNGTPAVAFGQETAALAGQVLRRGAG